jgi:hypothetical protein
MNFDIMVMHLLGFTEMANKLSMQEINQNLKLLSVKQYLTNQVEN